MAAGEQQPRICWLPESSGSSGPDAVALASLAGLVLDPWQAYVLEHSLGERADGKWAAFEVGLVVGRQNGKGAVLEARELAGLFLLGEKLIIHSAHLFKTSQDHFRRMLRLIEGNPDFENRVRRIGKSHGEESIELRDGRRMEFQTRTKGAGRGRSADLVVMDEAMFLGDAEVAALMPTLTTSVNPQIWYTGSAVDQQRHSEGVQFARIRERGRTGEKADRLAYFEWSVECDDPDLVTDEIALNEKSWAQSNPGLGLRITSEFISAEYDALDTRSFSVERLGVGDWPPTSSFGASLIGVNQWRVLADSRSYPVGAVCFALDVTPDRSWSSISAVGEREDGLTHVELVERRRGTGWVPERVVELMTKNDNVGSIVIDGRGPAASLIDELENKGVEVLTASAADQAAACGMFYDAVVERKLRHRGQGEVESAVRGGTSRPLGDAWAWSRKSSAVDISPLVSATLAFWGLTQVETSEVMVAFA